MKGLDWHVFGFILVVIPPCVYVEADSLCRVSMAALMLNPWTDVYGYIVGIVVLSRGRARTWMGWSWMPIMGVGV